MHFLNCTLYNLITNEFSSLEKLVLPEQCRSLKVIILITTYSFHIIGGEERLSNNYSERFKFTFFKPRFTWLVAISWVIL